MKQNIKTLIRLSTPLVIAIAPFMVMHKPAASCSNPTEITICILTDQKISIWLQTLVTAASGLVIYISYRILKTQVKSPDIKKAYLLFSSFLSVLAAIISVGFYDSIRGHHSQEAFGSLSTVSHTNQPYFGYGLKPVIFYGLVAIFVVPSLVYLQRGLLNKKISLPTKKIRLFK